MVPIAGDTLTRLKRAHFTFIHLAVIAVWFALALQPARATSKHAGRAARVQTGLDVLEAQKFAPLRGKHVGIITNHTGRIRKSTPPWMSCHAPLAYNS